MHPIHCYNKFLYIVAAVICAATSFVFMHCGAQYYTLLEQFYAIFMRRQIYFVFIELLISMQCRHQNCLSVSWSLILWFRSSIMCYFLNFKFLRRRDSLHVYACGPHVLYIVLMSIIHPHIGKHDVGGGNHGCVRWNVHLVKSFLRSNKINFYSFNH
jgi:hypothetical protein